MSFPRNKSKFDAWHKAMVAGATVDKPDYGKTSSRPRVSRKTQKRRRRKRKKTNRQRRMKNG